LAILGKPQEKRQTISGIYTSLCHTKPNTCTCICFYWGYSLLFRLSHVTFLGLNKKNWENESRSFVVVVVVVVVLNVFYDDLTQLLNTEAQFCLILL